jgi:membrane-associated protein
MTGLLQHFAYYLQHYGYWTVAAALLLENAGLPVPGETTLIAASVFAQANGSFNLRDIIVIATIAATVGDNLGYAIGRWGGRPLLERYRAFFHLRPAILRRGERLFARYGSVTIFFARFVIGLRVLAGPLAGALRMDWTRFAIFNALGALAWVTVIASVSYAFGRQLPALARTMRTANLAILAVILLLAVLCGKRLLARLDQDTEE